MILHKEGITMSTATREIESIIKLEIDQSDIGENNDGSKSTSPQMVEVEILPPVDVTDPRKVEIYKGITEIDAKLNEISSRIEELNSEVDSLTNKADGIDYTVAVASGVIAGIIDSVWCGEFSLENASKWGTEKVNKFVTKVAQNQGYKGDDLQGAVKYLEDKFPIAADKATNDFGGGLQHHLRDFSHHPTVVGLFFSLLTQFTKKVYGTDTAGMFKVVSVGPLALIGNSFPEKITFGVVNWFFHMVSDMAGSSTSIANGTLGTGLPGPIVSLLKEVSALPIFRKMNEKGYKEFSVWISKLFNGTLFAKKDAAGNITESIKFDLRTEIGTIHELGRQAVPVIVNECIVRGFYFIRKLFAEIDKNNVKNISDLKNINWKNTLPFKNRTVVRMLTISSSTFLAFDIADAAIRSGGFNGLCILRINFVGIGRFAIAVGSDISMGIKKYQKESERSRLTNERLKLMSAKVYYKVADMWIAAESAGKAINESYKMIEPSIRYSIETWSVIHDTLDDVSTALQDKRQEEALLNEFVKMYFEN